MVTQVFAIFLFLTNSFFTLYGLVNTKESLLSQIFMPVLHYLDGKSTYMPQQIRYMLKYMKYFLQS